MDRFSQDPYSILGLPPDATKSQIRRAYRRLAMRFHPDRNPDYPEAEERFKHVQWAYENLIGQKGQEGISSMVFRRKFNTAPFSKSDQSFYDFFSAMRTHYAKKRDSGEVTCK